MSVNVMKDQKLQGNTKLFPVDHTIHGIFILVQKESKVKKECFC
jgi:hypothetical protein